MNTKTLKERRWILGFLALLMAFTRFHHEGSAVSLPDASLAVFFLAGMFLSSPRLFVLLLAEALLIDIVAIAGFGVDGYCLSPAYVFLIPTYGAMWLAGQWCSRQSHRNWAVYGSMLAGSLLVSASVAFLISSFSFFWFSGKVSSIGQFDYAESLAGQYFSYVGATAVYALIGLGVEASLKYLALYRPNEVDIS
jgi:hypothetical protein